MGSGTGKVLHVAWICHFSNREIQERLGVRRPIHEFAPWITLGIEEVKKRDDMILHVISPHLWIDGVRSFSDGSIHYHFFNPGIPRTGRPWPRSFRWDLYTNFYSNRKKISNILKKVNPDIIHLHGAENAYYSYAALDIRNKPVLCTIQGFIAPQVQIAKGQPDLMKRVEVERRIFSNLKHFGVRVRFMYDEIRQWNAQAVFHHHEYFYATPEARGMPKEYDVVFFSKITKAKGIEDLIAATEIIAKVLPKVRIAVCGRTSASYMRYLHQMCREKGVEKNIDFVGFLPTQDDLFDVVDKARVCVLPTYNDTIPGTIIESMFLKVPVVTYDVGGISDLKDVKPPVAHIVQVGDVPAVADRVVRLLGDVEHRNAMASNALKYAARRWCSSNSMDEIMNIYHKILKYG
jgi:glycosyltransferase involved in cell wall biosynthesis